MLRDALLHTEKNNQQNTPKNVVKKKRLTNCDVSDFITKNNIRKESELT